MLCEAKHFILFGFDCQMYFDFLNGLSETGFSQNPVREKTGLYGNRILTPSFLTPGVPIPGQIRVLKDFSNDFICALSFYSADRST